MSSIVIVLFRGKGEYYRLGNESTSVQPMPTLVDGLASKTVTQVAVGAIHCLALTSSGEVSNNLHVQYACTCTYMYHPLLLLLLGIFLG